MPTLSFSISRLAPQQGFDLIIGTNVFVYFGEFEQSLARLNMALMLNRGGFVLSNDKLPNSAADGLTRLLPNHANHRSRSRPHRLYVYVRRRQRGLSSCRIEAMATQLKLLAETTAPVDEIAQILRAEHGDPFHILGMHLVEVQGKRRWRFAPSCRARMTPGWCADRARPTWCRSSASMPTDSSRRSFPGEQAMFPYRLRTDYAGQHEFEDPYRFPPVLSDFDLHLLAEGTHHKTYEKLGAHVTEIAGVRGVSFAVWAPNAQRVSVVGNFNHWDGRQHPLRVRGATGVWEIFIPGLREGELYKFEIKGRYKQLPGVEEPTPTASMRSCGPRPPPLSTT